MFHFSKHNNHNNFKLFQTCIKYINGGLLLTESILVVDDDEDFLKVLTILLKREGYNIDTASTGKEALEKTTDNFYSLILVDRKLPDIDGVQLVTKIQDTDPKMRKVIFTGFPSLNNVQQAIDFGVDAYLTKPIDPVDILNTIKDQLNKRDKDFKERYTTLK